jgi:hypothetical protein
MKSGHAIMFPIKDRIIIHNGHIVCAYLDNVLISDEQCQLIGSLFDDDYNIGSVEFEVEIDNKDYLMYYYYQKDGLPDKDKTYIYPLTFHYGESANVL